MSFEALVNSVRPNLTDAMRREWHRMASPGTWWSGSERVAVARITRQAQEAVTIDSGALPDVATGAVLRLAIAPATTTRDGIAEQTAAGLEHPAYVELVGVVSRVVAVDATHRALGTDLEPLPEPLPGSPSRTSSPTQAMAGKAFVPMLGGASIVGALSLVPAEMEAQRDIHEPFYMSYEEMSLFDYQRALHRTQMELVAARTSAVNECFY
jgi:hypothetical protein